MRAITLCWPATPGSEIVLLIVGLCIVLMPWIFGVINSAWVVRLHPAPGGEECVDVYIAVRNEGNQIGPCIASLLLQPSVARIVVVDDGSTDSTLARVREIASTEPRLLWAESGAIRGGKSEALAWAIQQFTPRTPFLLFTDADVRFDADAIHGLVLFAHEKHYALVTAWLRCDARHYASRLCAPQVTLFLLRFLPFFALKFPDQRFAAANGQCMLVARDAYVRSGGHAQITDLVEDVALARAIKGVGGRIGLVSGRYIGTYLGYASLVDNLHGYGRSLAFGLGVIGAWAFATWQILNVVVVFGICFWLASWNVWFALAAMLGLRLGNALAFSENPLSLLLAPIGDLLFALAAIVGALDRTRRTTNWRGRACNGANR